MVQGKFHLTPVPPPAEFLLSISPVKSIEKFLLRKPRVNYRILELEFSSNSSFLRVLYIFFSDFLCRHCVKRVRIQSFSGPQFPAFGLNTPYLTVFSPNVAKYGPEELRIRTLFTQ